VKIHVQKQHPVKPFSLPGKDDDQPKDSERKRVFVPENAKLRWRNTGSNESAGSTGTTPRDLTDAGEVSLVEDGPDKCSGVICFPLRKLANFDRIELLLIQCFIGEKKNPKSFFLSNAKVKVPHWRLQPRAPGSNSTGTSDSRSKDTTTAGSNSAGPSSRITGAPSSSSKAATADLGSERINIAAATHSGSSGMNLDSRIDYSVVASASGPASYSHGKNPRSDPSSSANKDPNTSGISSKLSSTLPTSLNPNYLEFSV